MASVQRGGSFHPAIVIQPPLTCQCPGHSSAFSYDHERRRWKQVQTSPAGTETRYYVEGLYERVVSPGLTEHVHHIRADGERVAIVKRWNTDQALLTRWVHTDHLGSIVATSPAQTALAQSGIGSVEFLRYDAWGQRRDPFTWATSSGQPGQWTRKLLKAKVQN